MAALLTASTLPPRFVSRIRDLARGKDVATAQQLIEAQRPRQQEITAEWLAAVSWLARGASFAGQWDLAEKYAREAFDGGVQLLEQRPLDTDRHLPTALGAGIEVLGQVHEAAGNRATAVEFLRQQRRRYAGTSIETRIQKNLLLLDLEGKPFPPLETAQFIGEKPPAPDELRGKVVLFFFWAHWCGDCQAQKPILAALHEQYADDGLVIIGPTQLYGYVAGGEDATPEQEFAYISNSYQQRNPIPSWMPVPLSSRNFVNFGVSTTPTLVIVDRGGIVRLYHPGKMNYEELARQIEPLLGEQSD